MRLLMLNGNTNAAMTARARAFLGEAVDVDAGLAQSLALMRLTAD